MRHDLQSESANRSGSRNSSRETRHNREPRFQCSSYSLSVGPVHPPNADKDHPHSPKFSKMARETSGLAIEEANSPQRPENATLAGIAIYGIVQSAVNRAPAPLWMHK